MVLHTRTVIRKEKCDRYVKRNNFVPGESNHTVAYSSMQDGEEVQYLSRE